MGEGGIECAMVYIAAGGDVVSEVAKAVRVEVTRAQVENLAAHCWRRGDWFEEYCRYVLWAMVSGECYGPACIHEVGVQR